MSSSSRELVRSEPRRAGWIARDRNQRAAEALQEMGKVLQISELGLKFLQKVSILRVVYFIKLL